MDGDTFSVLLRRRGLISGASRHVYNSRRGIMCHRFEFDARRRQLVATLWHWNELCSRSPLPLHHTPAKLSWDAGDVPFSAVIREEIVDRYDYVDGQLENRATELFYKVQEGDTLRDVARHYLGARAPARAVLDANPDVRDAFTPKQRKYPARVRLDAGTRLRIPIDEDWLREFYGL
jgi:hypothetical protein